MSLTIPLGDFALLFVSCGDLSLSLSLSLPALAEDCRKKLHCVGGITLCLCVCACAHVRIPNASHSILYAVSSPPFSCFQPTKLLGLGPPSRGTSPFSASGNAGMPPPLRRVSSPPPPVGYESGPPSVGSGMRVAGPPRSSSGPPSMSGGYSQPVPAQSAFAKVNWVDTV